MYVCEEGKDQNKTHLFCSLFICCWIFAVARYIIDLVMYLLMYFSLVRDHNFFGMITIKRERYRHLSFGILIIMELPLIFY